MLKYYVKRSGGEDFQRVMTPPMGNVWVHGDDVAEAELAVLAKRYDMDINILRDVLDVDELPRVEIRSKGLYVFVRSIRRGKRGQVIASPVLLGVRGSVFVSLSADGIADPKVVMPKLFSETGSPIDLLLGSFAQVIGEYESLIQRTSRYIKDTARRLQTHEVTNADFIKFVTVEDNLNEYRMNLNGMLVVAQRLQETFNVSEDKEAVEDIVLYIRQLMVAIDSHSQSITSIRNAYSTIANNVLNQRMKALTVLTLLVALPNVFYGMYGMNVTLPYADQPWAYTAIVVFTFFLIFVIYLLAKRLKLF